MKITNITPEEFYCGVGACPSVHITDRGTLIIVGSIVGTAERDKLPDLRIGVEETVVEVPIGLLRKIKQIVEE